MDALTGRPDYAAEDWLILVTTDHSGLGFSHGGTSQEEQEIFFIANGSSVTASVELMARVLEERNKRNEFYNNNERIS